IGSQGIVVGFVVGQGSVSALLPGAVDLAALDEITVGAAGIVGPMIRAAAGARPGAADDYPCAIGKQVVVGAVVIVPGFIAGFGHRAGAGPRVGAGAAADGVAAAAVVRGVPAARRSVVGRSGRNPGAVRVQRPVFRAVGLGMLVAALVPGAVD